MLLILGCAVACHSHAPPPPPIGDATARTCPGFVDFELDPGSRFLPGWSGIAHGIGLNTGSRFSVQIDSCDADCRLCVFHGPVRNTTDAVVAQRCQQQLGMTCSDDSGCGSAGPCLFALPPISSTVGIATCNVAFFSPADPPPIGGTIDLVTGELDLSRLRILVDVHQGACVACINDPAANDGKMQGTCGSAATTCDINGKDSATSYDCPVGPLFFGIEVPLVIDGTSTGGRSWTMDPTSRPLCTGTGSGAPKHCWCGMCSDGTPCTDSRQCPSGACTGSGSAGSYNTLNNSCGSAGCAWSETTHSGKCVGSTTSCFPDTGTISAVGFAEVHEGFYTEQIANITCMPPFNPNLDGVIGVPGPLLFHAHFHVVTR
jgi:hypothetical protein